LFACSALALSKAIGELGSEHHTTSQEGGRGSLPLQTSQVTIEVVLISRNGSRIGVLPESVVAPPSRQSANAAGIASDPQRAGRSESGVVTGAALPPIGGGVDHWVATLTGVVGVGEIADPADHRSSTQAIASGTIRVICPTKDGRSVGGYRKLKVRDPYIRCRGHPGG